MKFFHFLKLFLTSAHQNDLKYIKKNYFKQKTISKFLGTQFAPHSQTLSSSIDVVCGNLIKKIIDCFSRSGLLTSLITIKDR